MARQPEIQYIQFYTDGSAARKLNQVKPNPSLLLPKAQKKKRRVVYVDPVAVLGIVVAVCMLVMMAIGVAELVAQRRYADAMEGYAGRLNLKNEQLTEEYESSYDLEVIRQAALNMGMVSAEQVEHIPLYPPIQTVRQAEEPTFWQRVQGFISDLLS